jgi:hypothetical protein
MKLNASDLRVVRGRWEHIQVWRTVEDYEAFKRGEFVTPIFFEEVKPNGITDVGIHYLLDAGFRGVAAISTWYAGLIDNAGYTGVAASDTSASHSGWSQSGAYTETALQTLSFGAAASRQISASVSFSINASVTIEGIFVNSVSTKPMTTGTLWSTALFSTAPSLVNGNVLTATYTLSD